MHNSRYTGWKGKKVLIHTVKTVGQPAIQKVRDFLKRYPLKLPDEVVFILHYYVEENAAVSITGRRLG